MKNLYTLIIIMLAFTATVNAQVSEQEFQALKAIYNATGGDNWTNHTGWENINTTATKDDVTTAWYGFDGNSIEDGHVKELDFYGNNLIGQLPDEIGDLIYLRGLTLSSNHLTGPIPQTVGNLVNLLYFSVTGNAFNTPFPSDILQKLTSLEMIYLDDCGFTGILPDIFDNLPLLNYIELSQNQLEGELPPSLSRLKHLTTLYISSNLFTGDLPPLDSCKDLYQLSANSNGFTGSIPSTYASFTSLKYVYLSNNNLSGVIPAGIFNPALNRLWINENLFTFEGLEPVINQINSNIIKYYKTDKLFELHQNTLSVNKDEPLNLNASTLSIHNLGGNNNRYKWFRNDVEVYSGNNPSYTIASASAAHAGIYRFEVTNTVVTGIILKSENIAVSVIGSNHPPTDITLTPMSTSENYVGQFGPLTATDPDTGDTHIFTLATGNGTNDRDNNQFSITGNFLNISGANFEATTSLNILITVNDGNGGFFTKAFVITVNNVNEVPVFKGQVTSNTIDENTANGSVVLTLTGEDPEGSPVTFSITGGNENGAFGINSNKLVVSDNTKLNYDVKNSYSLTVNISDGALSSSITLTVSLNKMNSLPVVQNATFSIDENSPAGTVIGSVTASDREGDPLTYSILSGNELSAFSLVGNTLSVTNNEPLDFETNPAFTIIINVTDGISTVPATVIINLNNVQELTDNDILTISVPGIVGEAEIDALAHTVRVYVSNVDLRSLAATYTLSPQANANPASGATFDFSAAQSVTVTSQSGNAQVWTVTVTYQTGENEINGLHIKVYPNPSSGFLHVSGLDAGSQIKIVSYSGQIMFCKTVNNLEEIINIEHFKDGIYLLLVENRGNKSIQKFIKK